MTNPTTHYAVIQIIPTDINALAAYRRDALAAVLKHGGQKFAGGLGREILEDGGAGSTEIVVVSFPSAKAAHSWMNDPELEALHALRNHGAKPIVLLPGA